MPKLKHFSSNYTYGPITGNISFPFFRHVTRVQLLSLCCEKKTPNTAWYICLHAFSISWVEIWVCPAVWILIKLKSVPFELIFFLFPQETRWLIKSIFVTFTETFARFMRLNSTLSVIFFKPIYCNCTQFLFCLTMIFLKWSLSLTLIVLCSAGPINEAWKSVELSATF